MSALQTISCISLNFTNWSGKLHLFIDCEGLFCQPSHCYLLKIASKFTRYFKTEYFTVQHFWIDNSGSACNAINITCDRKPQNASKVNINFLKKFHLVCILIKKKKKKKIVTKSAILSLLPPMKIENILLPFELVNDILLRN